MAGHFNSQTGRTLAIAALLAGLAAAPALAENIPLPKPRPTITGTTAAAVPNAALGARAQAPQPQATQPPNPVSNPFAALLGRPGAAAALSSEQRGIIEKVNTYLSNMQVLSGNFIQVAPDARRSRASSIFPSPAAFASNTTTRARSS